MIRHVSTLPYNSGWKVQLGCHVTLHSITLRALDSIGPKKKNQAKAREVNAQCYLLLGLGWVCVFDSSCWVRPRGCKSGTNNVRRWLCNYVVICLPTLNYYRVTFNTWQITAHVSAFSSLNWFRPVFALYFSL